MKRPQLRRRRRASMQSLDDAAQALDEPISRIRVSANRFSHHAQGVIWFRLEKGPLHLVADQYFKLEQLDGGDH